VILVEVRIPLVLLAAVACAVLLPPQAARALIKQPYPLAQMLGEAEQVFEARVASVDAEKKRLVVEWVRDLKGETSFARLNINLRTAKKADDTEAVLKRVAEKLPLVAFSRRVKDETVLILFTEGTWFSLATKTPPAPREDGAKAPAGTAACGLNVCEVYLRRTFAGKTKELLALLPEVLAGRKKAPPWNGDVKPGLGPELPPPKEEPEKTQKPEENAPRPQEPGTGARTPSSHASTAT
jgi:hypothetical protein